MVQRRVLHTIVSLCALVLALPGTAPAAGIDIQSAAAWSAFGPHPVESFGESIAPTGDVNGDGIADLLVNSTGTGGPSEYRSARARAYVLFRHPDTPSSTQDLNDLAPEDGYRIFSDRDESFIWSLADAGDVNGDQIPDQVIGLQDTPVGPAPAAYPARVVVLFGRRSSGPVNLDALTAADGYRFDGPASSLTGFEVKGAGDVNGDQIPDQLVTSPSATFGPPEAGSAWVLFGRRPTPTSPIDLSALGASDGYRIDGPQASSRLSSVDNAGDVNGDGTPDQIVGTPYIPGSTGRAYIVFGRKDGAAGPTELSALGTGGYVITGTEGFGVAVASAGDVSGDGIPDQLIGSAPRFLSDSVVGQVYVVFGQRGSTSAIDGQNPTPATGYAIHGARPGARTGWWVRNAGDVNGDGIPDALLDDWGAATAAGAGAGSAFIVFGRRGTEVGPVELATLGPGGGYRIDGSLPGGAIGTPIDAGDVNGDGHHDQFVASPGLTDPRAHGQGAIYLIHAPTLPASIAPPTIEGDVRAGGTATCRPAARLFNASLNERIAWLRDGAEIAAAGAATHAVDTEDLGHTLTCRVTLSGVLGDRAAVSAGVAVPRPPGPPAQPPSRRFSASVARSLLPADRAAAGRCATGLLLVVRVTGDESLSATIEARVGGRLIVRRAVRTHSPASRHVLCVGSAGRSRLVPTRSGALPTLAVEVLRSGRKVAATRGRLIVRRSRPAGVRGTTRSSAAGPRRAPPRAPSR